MEFSAMSENQVPVHSIFRELRVLGQKHGTGISETD